jgi:L-amino acid N-acyltransferase YncA
MRVSAMLALECPRPGAYAAAEAAGGPCRTIDELRMSVSIRPVAAADIPAITRIYAHAVRHGTASFELEPPSEAEMARRHGVLTEGGFPYLVAVEGADLAGYAYAGPYRLRPAYRFTVEDSIYVAPECHRRGVGRALVDALITAAGTRGFRQMIAVIGDSAQAPSIALHRACGFRMVGTFAAVGYKFDRWLDTVLMQHDLGEGAATPPTP